MKGLLRLTFNVKLNYDRRKIKQENIESFDLTRKVNLLRFSHGKNQNWFYTIIIMFNIILTERDHLIYLSQISS